MREEILNLGRKQLSHPQIHPTGLVFYPLGCPKLFTAPLSSTPIFPAEMVSGEEPASALPGYSLKGPRSRRLELCCRLLCIRSKLRSYFLFFFPPLYEKDLANRVQKCWVERTSWGTVDGGGTSRMLGHCRFRLHVGTRKGLCYHGGQQ